MLPENLIPLPDRLSGLANQPPPLDDSSQSSDNSNLIDSFLKQASNVQRAFTDISKAYPHSSKTSQDVQNAIALWINETVSGIKTGEPERPDNFG